MSPPKCRRYMSRVRGLSNEFADQGRRVICSQYPHLTFKRRIYAVSGHVQEGSKPMASPTPKTKERNLAPTSSFFASFMRALAAPPRLLPEDKKELSEIEEGFK